MSPGLHWPCLGGWLERCDCSRSLCYVFLFSSEWIKDIGLECYQQTFHDALIDGNMLNSITFVNILNPYAYQAPPPPPPQEDLELLDISTPFHIASIQRGIQAFRYALM